MEGNYINRLVTAGVAGKILGVSPNTIRAWVRKGILSAYYTPDGGNRMKFWTDDIYAVAKKGGAC